MPLTVAVTTTMTMMVVVVPLLILWLWLRGAGGRRGVEAPALHGEQHLPRKRCRRAIPLDRHRASAPDEEAVVAAAVEGEGERGEPEEEDDGWGGAAGSSHGLRALAWGLVMGRPRSRGRGT